jgi:hypothetical protein
MKGLETMLANMVGLDPNQLQAMMKGFVDNAAYLAENIDVVKRDIAEIKATQKAICHKLGIEPVPMLLIEEGNRSDEHRTN